jgi:hypothetical protein
VFAIAVAWLLLVLGSLISVVNFYLSFLRPLRFRRCPEKHRHISGIPQIGAMMCVGSYFLFAADSPFRVVAIFSALIDTGSIHWFPIAAVWNLWRGQSNTLEMGKVKGGDSQRGG